MKNYFEKSEILPSDPDIIKCSDLLARVEDMAPSNSNVLAKINQLEDGNFQVIIDIYASCGKFHAEAQNKYLMSSLKQAQYSILKKLNHWKAVRFSLSSDY